LRLLAVAQALLLRFQGLLHFLLRLLQRLLALLELLLLPRKNFLSRFNRPS
jgi:hypothetical protein